MQSLSEDLPEKNVNTFDADLMYLRFSMKLNSNIFDTDCWGTVGL